MKREQNNLMTKFFIIVAVAASVLLIPIRSDAQSSELKIRVMSTKLPDLLAFLRSVAEKPHSSKTFRMLFEQSRAADTLSSEALDRFKNISLKSHALTYHNLPHSKPLYPLNFYRMAAVKATGWDDFRDRTVGLYSNELVLQAMHDLKPIYHALIWQPYHTKFQRKVDSLEFYMKNHEMGDLLQKMAQFYGSSRPSDLPVEVDFYPLPCGQGFSANVSGNVVFSGMPVCPGNYADHLSIIFHELGHRLYSQEPTGLAHLIRRTILTSAAPSRLFAYRWLNEALATATSNWVYYKLTGHLYKGSWYANRYIAGYARAIYPRVSAYLNGGKQLDKDLMRYAATQFEATFPNALTDPSNILTYTWILMNAPRSKRDEFRKTLYKMYQPRWVNSTKLNSKNLEKALNTSLTTIIILTSHSPKAKQLIEDHFPALLQHRSKPYAYKLIDGSHPVLLLQAETPKQLLSIFNEISNQKLTLSLKTHPFKNKLK